jgi:hypothetical protein
MAYTRVKFFVGIVKHPKKKGEMFCAQAYGFGEKTNNKWISLAPTTSCIQSTFGGFLYTLIIFEHQNDIDEDTVIEIFNGLKDSKELIPIQEQLLSFGYKYVRPLSKNYIKIVGEWFHALHESCQIPF